MGISMKELKKNRLTPAEKFVLETIDGVKPETPRNGDFKCWYKDNKLLFTQDFNDYFLWVKYDTILGILYNEFGLNDNEIKYLLTNLLYDYTDNGRLMIV